MPPLKRHCQAGYAGFILARIKQFIKLRIKLSYASMCGHLEKAPDKPSTLLKLFK